MKIRRTMKQSGKKVDRKLSGGKRKVKKKRAVVAVNARRVGRTPSKRALQGAKAIKRETAGAKRTTRSKAREAGKAMGTLLGKAIGNTERLINGTAGIAKDFLS